MKARLRVCTIVVFLFCVADAFAQHVEVGAFASYGRIDVENFPKNAVGLGGRIDFNVHPNVQIEGELSYDFKYPKLTITSTSIAATVTETKLGILRGNAGLKLQTRGGSYFLFLKGGANAFRPEARTNVISAPPLNVSLLDIRDAEFTKGTLLYGGGIGFHAGPLGIRFDIGDEIFWIDGARHNLRVTFGPTFRF